MKYELKEVKLDGVPAFKLRCPACGVWAYLDDDQYHGRVSVDHTPCPFHVTVDFSKASLRKARNE